MQLIVVAVIVISTRRIAYCCTEKTFQRGDGSRYNGGIIERYGHHAVREEDCIRACRLTRDCGGFNVEWLGPIGGVGYCELLDTSTYAGLIPDETRSFFGICPSAMTFHPETSRCYRLVRSRRTWSESQAYCRTIHPRAYLAQIRSPEQHHAFNSIATGLAECRFTKRGDEYLGNMTTTITGRTCLRWGVHVPHEHQFLFSYPLNWTLEENYCRNPDSDDSPWCYTTDVNKRFELCNIPQCTPYLDPDTSTPSFGLWLGASRKDPPGAEVIWYNTSQSVVSAIYQSLETGEPVAPSTGKHCLRTFREQWSMSDCEEIKAFVCEYNV